MMCLAESHVSVAEVALVDENVENARRCTKRGCVSPAEEDSELCPDHHARDNASKRRYAKRRRKEAEAKGLCSRCWRYKAVKGARNCPSCMIEVGGIKRRLVDRNVENRRPSTSRDYVEVDGYARTRGHGQGKRGAPSIDDCDDFDRKVMDQGMQRYRDGMAYLATEEGKALPRLDREAARMAALGQLDLALRAGDEITARHKLHDKRAKAEGKRVEDRTRDRERRLAGLAREIAKSGR